MVPEEDPQDAVGHYRAYRICEGLVFVRRVGQVDALPGRVIPVDDLDLHCIQTWVSCTETVVRRAQGKLDLGFRWLSGG